jgi:hypothetical protein
VQYHPEHTFATTTAIIEASQDRLVAEGADARTGAVVGFSRFRAGRDRGYAQERGIPQVPSAYFEDRQSLDDRAANDAEPCR